MLSVNIYKKFCYVHYDSCEDRADVSVFLFFVASGTTMRVVHFRYDDV